MIGIAYILYIVYVLSYFDSFFLLNLWGVYELCLWILEYCVIHGWRVIISCSLVFLVIISTCPKMFPDILALIFEPHYNSWKTLLIVICMLRLSGREFKSLDKLW